MVSAMHAVDLDPTVDRFLGVRGLTEALAAPLSPEDQTVQSMPDVSPTKWHRAHTSWFFETFLLADRLPDYRLFHPEYGYLFNSYYVAVGDRYERPARGLLSRPGMEEIGRYRAHVDAAMVELLHGDNDPATDDLVELGLHHEQQHQELMLMDIKHVLSRNPLRPAYDYLAPPAGGSAPPSPLRWHAHEGGQTEIGHDGHDFAYDNESPRHAVYLRPFSLASRTVTCGEWQAFIDDGGYRRPELWLSDGWATVEAEGWDAPLYWARSADSWTIFTLGGERPLAPSEPVCHISLYEADAYARWADARLPTEAEWEAVAASRTDPDPDVMDPSVLHPRPESGGEGGLLGGVWQWTASAYAPYPGFRPAAGAVGEYNGKFMVNQYVLRGGCCATPPGHVRASYRNFYPAASRWPFAGLRLARDL